MTTSERRYIVKRLAEIPADDPARQELAKWHFAPAVPCLAEAESYGPMPKREAQRKAQAIFAETGDFASIYDADTGQEVAAVKWGGGLFLAYEYDDMGEKLPIDYENCFWSDVDDAATNAVE